MVPCIVSSFPKSVSQETVQRTTVSQMMRSQLVQGVFDRLAAHSQSRFNDIELCFAPQSLYLDAGKRDAGRFAYLRLDEMGKAWPILCAHGVVDAGVSPDAAYLNRSPPVLQVDIGADLRSQLRSCYLEDHLKLYDHTSS